MIFLTGSNGFIGKNIITYFGNLGIIRYKREDEVRIDPALIVIHLAGRAHDIENTTSTDEYYQANTILTQNIFDAFLSSPAKVFITLSSVKACADSATEALTENHQSNPGTDFGRSKLFAENYIFASEFSEEKRVYILRPCMIHGFGNKGNLNLLFKTVSKNIPWPLGAIENKRSFCSIENLMFIIKELIERDDIPSGIYNVSDDEALSTIELIGLIAKSQNRKPKVWNIPHGLINCVAFLGDKLHLPLNTERLQLLTSSFVVSNAKIKAAIGKPLPVSSREGLLKTFKSFNNK
jgi:nucleoside-diphosphate-sugar epimerase